MICLLHNIKDEFWEPGFKKPRFSTPILPFGRNNLPHLLAYIQYINNHILKKWLTYCTKCKLSFGSQVLWKFVIFCPVIGLPNEIETSQTKLNIYGASSIILQMIIGLLHKMFWETSFCRKLLFVFVIFQTIICLSGWKWKSWKLWVGKKS